MKILHETRSVFGNTDFWKKNAWALALISLITSFFTISIVPFTRKDFGERYFGYLNLYFGYSLIATYIFFDNVLGAFIRHGSSHLMQLFLFAFIGLSIYHRREIARKNKTGIEWHSMYIGTSLLGEMGLPFSQEKIYKVFEPLTVFLVGALFWQFSGQIGLWLMISAASLLVSNHIVFYQERQAILDLRDAHIEAKYLGDAFAGRPATETAGFVVAESSIRLIGSDAKLRDAFSRLSTEMKSLLDTPPDFADGSVA